LYELLPNEYVNGFFIVFWIGLAKVYDAVLGNNNSILYNSDYYRSILFFGVLLALLAIGLNLWLIPTYGLKGSLKLMYVKSKFDIIPFTKETLKVIVLLCITGALFYYLQFSFHPIINIALKSMLMIALYGGILYRFKISEDVYGVISKFLKR